MKILELKNTRNKIKIFLVVPRADVRWQKKESVNVRINSRNYTLNKRKKKD